MKLPHELAVLPDEAVVQWGWVRRKLVAAGEEDPNEGTFRMWEAIAIEHLFCSCHYGVGQPEKAAEELEGKGHGS